MKTGKKTNKNATINETLYEVQTKCMLLITYTNMMLSLVLIYTSNPFETLYLTNNKTVVLDI
jgi:hypothetical protein